MTPKWTRLPDSRSQRGIAFCVLFFLALAAGCNSQATLIEKVLQADSTTSANAKSIAEVVKRMREIDTSKCPQDFQSCYLAHIHAWEDAKQVEQKAITYQTTNTDSSVFVESFVRGFLGDPLGKYTEMNASKSDLQREIEVAQKLIQQTFHEVERVALKYGAKVQQASP